jgi:hypothetical protein
MEEILTKSEMAMNRDVFVYQTAELQWEPSEVFTFSHFRQGLRVMYEDGVAGKYFYLGTQTSSNASQWYGMVNIAAFLAQVMKEAMKYNACDENNWDLVRIATLVSSIARWY